MMAAAELLVVVVVKMVVEPQEVVAETRAETAAPQAVELVVLEAKMVVEPGQPRSPEVSLR